MNIARAAASGVLIVVVGGCAVFGSPEQEPSAAPVQPEMPAAPAEPEEPAVPSTPVEPPRPVAPAESERLLDYFRQLRRLGVTELNKEHEAARGAYLRTRSDFDRMRLAMAMLLSEASVKDEVRALELVDPIARNQGSPLNGLATLMHTFLLEQRRLEKSVQGMQQKLDALKEMERSLIERKR